MVRNVLLVWSSPRKLKIRFREIGVEPDFDYSLFVDTDKILGDMKMAELTIQNWEASESPGKDI